MSKTGLYDGSTTVHVELKKIREDYNNTRMKTIHLSVLRTPIQGGYDNIRIHALLS